MSYIENENEKKELLTKLFHSKDSDKSGFLTIDEALNCTSNLSDDVKGMVIERFKGMDQNKDGKISLDEFLEAYKGVKIRVG